MNNQRFSPCANGYRNYPRFLRVYNIPRLGIKFDGPRAYDKAVTIGLVIMILNAVAMAAVLPILLRRNNYFERFKS